MYETYNEIGKEDNDTLPAPRVSITAPPIGEAKILGMAGNPAIAPVTSHIGGYHGNHASFSINGRKKTRKDILTISLLGHTKGSYQLGRYSRNNLWGQ